MVTLFLRFEHSAHTGQYLFCFVLLLLYKLGEVILYLLILIFTFVSALEIYSDHLTMQNLEWINY